MKTSTTLRSLAILAGLLMSCAQAADFVIPWPPGGETDLLMRPIAPHLAKHLQQEVRVVNHPGQFGITGVLGMSKAPADGSTWVVVHDYAFSVEVSGKTEANPLKDLKPFCGIVEVPSVLATSRRAIGQRSPRDFIAGIGGMKASWTVGPTSTNYMMLALSAQKLGKPFEFRGYRSKEAAISALIDGEVDLAEVHINEPVPADKGLVMLGLASDRRDPLHPDLPTLKELGLDVQYRVVRALAVPKATPPVQVALLERACRAAAAEPALARDLAAVGARAHFTPAAEMARLLEDRRTAYLKVMGPPR